jgi:hypothetical protein
MELAKSFLSLRITLMPEPVSPVTLWPEYYETKSTNLCFN